MDGAAKGEISGFSLGCPAAIGSPDGIDKPYLHIYNAIMYKGAFKRI
jgi:hypothetical protein